MAVYLHGGKKFPPHDVLIIESDAWSEFQQKEEYLAKEEADRVSYLWDRLIEKLASDFQAGQIEFGPGLPEAERALRTMAREDRFSRRLLGEAFKEFIELSRTQAFARMTCSPSGILYVYLAAPRNWTRDFRKTQLVGRCRVARGLHPDVTTVVGIATEQYDPSGFSLDVAQLDIPEGTEEDACCMSKAQAQFGWFVDAQTKHRTVDEYPGSR